MKKIKIIATREFITRVRKKSFLIITSLGPFLFALVMVVPIWLKLPESTDKKRLYVCDETGLLANKLFTDNWNVEYTNRKLADAKVQFIQQNYQALLHLPAGAAKKPSIIILYSKERVQVKERMALQQSINTMLMNLQLEQLLAGHPSGGQTKAEVQIVNEGIFGEFEKQQDNPLLSGAGLVMGILIYFFILLYGVQVMRGVMEEKTNRIIEVLICSVKPFQLMTGKILGIGMVSLLQFSIWMCMSLLFSGVASVRYSKAMDLFSNKNIDSTLQNVGDVNQSLELNSMINYATELHIIPIVLAFLYFFLLGYLLYSSLFAAIGAAADSDTDVQQFMLPVTIPLFFCFMVIGSVLQNPHSTLAITLSLIPFTSPIIMMARMPFGVPWQQLLASMLILLSAFIFMAWLASRIYRIGILRYGKKASYKELFYWLFLKS